MKLLAIDTSGLAASVCIWDNKPVYTSTIINKNTHSVNLLPMIHTAFELSNLNIKDMDCIAVVNGPGSFTGIRIGVSTAKGLAQGLNKPCIAISTLEALAFSAYKYDSIICPMLDARSKQVYTAAYKFEFPPINIIEDKAIALSDFIKEIENLSDNFLFLGDGAVSYKEDIEKALKNKAKFYFEEKFYPDIALVAKLATYHINNKLHYYDLMPTYLRVPQAERMLKEGKIKTL